MAGRVERIEHGGKVVAVDPLHMPTEGGPLLDDGLEAHHAMRVPVRLLIVEVHQGNQIAQPMVGSTHRSFPRGTLVEFAVGHRVVDERGVVLMAKRERDANRYRQALAQGPTGHLHARCVRRHARHRQPAVVAAIGLQFLLREDAGLKQRRVQGNCVVPV